jgi:hypothetical protein
VVVGTWPLHTRSDIIEPYITNMCRRNLPAHLMNAVTIEVYGKRSRTGLIKCRNTQDMWDVWRSLKSHVNMDNVKLDGDDKPLWIGIHKSAQQRKEEAPFKFGIEVIKEKIRPEHAAQLEVCWRGKSVYMGNEPILTSYRGFFEWHATFTPKWCGGATPEQMVKLVDDKLKAIP